MNGQARREKLIELIKQSSSAISGTELAKCLDVSRQVIVQDIAILRSSGQNIISTYRGYLLLNNDSLFQRVFKVQHTDERIEDELNSIIDLGGTVLDVFVSHKAYGLIRVELNLKSRYDIAQFMLDLKSGKSTPLKNITSGYHYHTVSADSIKILNMIYQNLLDKDYLVKIDDWDWQYVAFPNNED